MLSNLQVCFNAVMPLFLIMGLGYGVKCLGGIRVEDVPGLNKMAFRFRSTDSIRRRHASMA